MLPLCQGIVCRSPRSRPSSSNPGGGFSPFLSFFSCAVLQQLALAVINRECSCLMRQDPGHCSRPAVVFWARWQMWTGQRGVCRASNFCAACPSARQRSTRRLPELQSASAVWTPAWIHTRGPGTLRCLPGAALWVSLTIPNQPFQSSSNPIRRKRSRGAQENRIPLARLG